MPVKRINPEGLLHWPPLTHVVISPAGRLAHIAGQAAVDPSFNVIGTDLRTQTAFAFKNLCTALAAAGSQPKDVVSTTIYIVELDEAKASIVAAAMEIVLDGQPFPSHANTMVGVASLASAAALIEISAIAAVLE